MSIKAITIHGFKSFRDPVTLTSLSDGHNVVVGRNGSGKSNFFAAIRFVLGDAYTSLSREERQALLYDASGATSTTLSAYVEITFDNSDARFPLPGDVVVLRRTVSLARDEYTIDRKAATKQEVTSLLESAGFSTSHPYYIVPQGRITHLTNATDAERLALLKEVSGTRVYEQRRAESLDILRSTDTRYHGSAELLAQLESRMDELAKEQGELQKFYARDKERRCLEYTIYQRELADLADMLETLENERRRDVDESNTRRAAWARQDQEVSNLEARAQDVQQELENIALEQTQLEQERRELARSQAQLDSRLDDLNEAPEEERAALEAALANVDAQVVERERALAERTRAHTEAVQALEAQRAALEHDRTRLAALYAKQGRAAHFHSVAERDAALEAELAELDTQAMALRDAEREAREACSAAQAHHATCVERRTALETELATRANAVSEAQQQWRALRDEREALLEQKKELWKQEAQTAAALTHAKDQLSSEQRTLASTMDRATAAGLQSVEAMAAREGITGVYGPLYQLFTVDDRYKTAVEATAGASLFHMVVDTDETAARLLALLQREKSGRVTFMPLNRLRPPDTHYPQAPDAVVMLRKLSFDEALLPAFKQVFGKTIICPRLDIAAAYVRSCQNLNAITLDGDQVDRRGALSGGFHDPTRSRLDAVKSVQTWLTRVDAAQTQLEQQRRELSELEQRVTQLYSDMLRCEAQRAHMQDQRAVALDDLTWQRRSEADAAARVERVKRVAATRAIDCANMATKRAALESEKGTPLEDRLTAAEHEELAALVARERNATATLATLTRQAVELGEAAHALSSELDERLRRSHAALEQRLARADEGAPRSEAAQALHTSRATTESRLQQAQARQDALQAELASLHAQLEQARGQGDVDADVARQQAQAERLAARKQRLLEQRARCNEKIRDLGVLPEDAFQKFQRHSTEQLAAQLHKARAALDEVAHVNKRAVEQFHSFSKQRDVLLQRHSELQASQASIRELIEVLDARKEAALQATVEQVASHFAAVFAQLVPGGHGELRLNESGVSLQVAFPPQRQAVRMAQLSGGQKSLVALALVFAIQRSDPAPFYLFDEIDANLDTQYRTAVAQCIQELAQEAQFITTTFRPELVERAHRWFGVLFSAQKVSSVVEIARDDARAFVEAAET